MAREDRAELGPVSDEGKEVTRRRERLGMHKNELADAAGVSRATLAAIEGGEGYRRASLTKIERALAEAEAEAGMTAPPREEPVAPTERRRRQSDVVIVRLKNDAGEVAVEGPVEDLAALQAAATAMLRSLAEATGAEGANVAVDPDL